MDGTEGMTQEWQSVVLDKNGNDYNLSSWYDNYDVMRMMMNHDHEHPEPNHYGFRWIVRTRWVLNRDCPSEHCSCNQCWDGDRDAIMEG